MTLTPTTMSINTKRKKLKPNDQQNTFPIRLDKILSFFSINKKEFAESIGLNPSSVTRWSIGENLPKSQLYSKICSQYGLSRQWLEYGQGEMFDSQKASSQITKSMEPMPIYVRQHIERKRDLRNKLRSFNYDVEDLLDLLDQGHISYQDKQEFIRILNLLVAGQS